MWDLCKQYGLSLSCHETVPTSATGLGLLELVHTSIARPQVAVGQGRPNIQLQGLNI